MEILADRLRWEHTATGIRVLIPACKDWRILFFLVWLPMWTLGGYKTLTQVIQSYASGKREWFGYFWLLGWAAGECVVTALLLWALGGQTSLQLDPGRLDTERSLFGLRLNLRSFATGEVRNLRYCPRTQRGRSSVESHLAFESADKTISFASGISDAEAFELIDKMLEVYVFPKDRALEYLDLSH